MKKKTFIGSQPHVTKPPVTKLHRPINCQLDAAKRASNKKDKILHAINRKKKQSHIMKNYAFEKITICIELENF